MDTRIVVEILAFIIAVTFHEAAHGYTAKSFGDDTPEREGRLTLNPLKHLDPFGSFIFPGLLILARVPYVIGWAKPVPINFNNLTPHRQGLMSVALAGPGMNLLLAWLAAVIIHFNINAHTLGNEFLISFINVNVMVAAFNLLPLPPLDGGRFLTVALPPHLGSELAKLEKYTPLILLSAMLLPLFFQLMGTAFSPLGFLLSFPYKFLLKLVLTLSGHG